MKTKETIISLFAIIDELNEHEQFKRKDFFELFDLSIKILDLSLKNESQIDELICMCEINSSLNEICNTLYNINATLSVHNIQIL